MAAPVFATQDESPVVIPEGPSLPVQRLFGVDMHSASLDDVFATVDAQIAARKPGFIVTPNVDHICRLQHDEAFQKAYGASLLALPDGVPIVWASRAFRKPLQRKISGSDLVYWLSEHAADKGHRVFFFGARPGVAEEAGRRLKLLYPKLQVAGAYCPPMGFDRDAEARDAAERAIKAAAPEIVFVALGCPKQELWMHEYYQQLGVPVLLGIGAGLDFVCGIAKRAPQLMQRMGLEWFWRLCHDPRRLAPRYLIHDSRFVLLLVREWRQSRQEQRQARAAKGQT